MIKFGLIGCGDISHKRVAPALRDSPLCELTAISRAQAHLAESFAREFGAKRFYADWQQVLHDDEVQAVYVATPVHLHAEQTIAAAEAGKHVLCEKPMAINVAECERMISACERNGVNLSIAYYRHFYPVIRRAQEIIQAGEIGTAVVAQINAFEWFAPEGQHPRAWLLKKDLSGGGPMFDFGCHRLEVLMDLFGSVSHVRSLSANNFFGREVEDVASVLLQFKTGPCATLTVAHSAAEPQDTFAVFGSGGSIHIPVLNVGRLRVVTGAGEREELHPPAANIHQPLIEDFARSIIEDRKPVVDGHIGRAVAEIEDEITRQSFQTLQ